MEEEGMGTHLFTERHPSPLISAPDEISPKRSPRLDGPELTSRGENARSEQMDVDDRNARRILRPSECLPHALRVPVGEKPNVPWDEQREIEYEQNALPGSPRQVEERKQSTLLGCQEISGEELLTDGWTEVATTGGGAGARSRRETLTCARRRAEALKLFLVLAFCFHLHLRMARPLRPRHTDTRAPSDDRQMMGLADRGTRRRLIGHIPRWWQCIGMNVYETRIQSNLP
ncbi:hypothetical protein FB45DRAFT_878240 [Roridomyces roridus]|uniref:Uncharacterized protein n=1 Tax=Roridomyces roridus TaxID=1738132 RepID=A0AAD7B0Y0_9AGAR|nr:hypothetical protein FB45DRAFT_878240 [Roridomyces roridus]